MIHLEGDVLDLLGLQRMSRGQLAGQPDHRLVEAGGRIDLELHVEELPAAAEIGHDLVEVGLQRTGEAVREIAAMAPGERVVEAALTLQRRGRALEALGGERGRPHPAARGLGLGEVGVTGAGALALDEAAGEAGRQRDGAGGAGGAAGLPLEPLEPPQLHDARATAMDAARSEDRTVYLPLKTATTVTTYDRAADGTLKRKSIVELDGNGKGKRITEYDLERKTKTVWQCDPNGDPIEPVTGRYYGYLIRAAGY